jgi:hypothetical protein
MLPRRHGSTEVCPLPRPAHARRLKQHYGIQTALRDVACDSHRAERVGLGGFPPGTPIFCGDSRSQTPQSRGGPEWPRGTRLRVVPGGKSPSPARIPTASYRESPPSESLKRPRSRRDSPWRQNAEGPVCHSHRGEGGVGGLPSPDPYLLRSFSKPNTTISWRARVPPGNAIKGGPGREAPQPRPRTYRFASDPARIPTASRPTS